MQPWLIWSIVGLFLILAEIFTPGFVLAIFGIACLGTAPVAAVLGLPYQLATFIVLSLVGMVLLRPMIQRWFTTASDGAKTNIEGMIGRSGTVTDPVGTDVSPGRVKIGAEEWRGISAEGGIIETGTTVEILRIDGATLYVRARN